jgi:hypothetical protein
MNIIIEDAESFKFLTSEGKWANTAAEGKHFTETTIAYNAARREPIGKFNIAGYIRETKQIINLRSGRGTGVTPVQ